MILLLNYLCHLKLLGNDLKNNRIKKRGKNEKQEKKILPKT